MRPTRPTTWSKEGAPSASGASRSFGGWKGKADDGRPSPPDPHSQSWERGSGGEGRRPGKDEPMKVDTPLTGMALGAVPAVARRAEALGYDAVNAGETTHDAFMLLTLAAEHTERVAI